MDNTALPMFVSLSAGVESSSALRLFSSQSSSCTFLLSLSVIGFIKFKSSSTQIMANETDANANAGTVEAVYGNTRGLLLCYDETLDSLKLENFKTVGGYTTAFCKLHRKVSRSASPNTLMDCSLNTQT